jgi:hypothetical protein
MAWFYGRIQILSRIGIKIEIRTWIRIGIKTLPIPVHNKEQPIRQGKKMNEQRPIRNVGNAALSQ